MKKKYYDINIGLLNYVINIASYVVNITKQFILISFNKDRQLPFLASSLTLAEPLLATSSPTMSI